MKHVGATGDRVEAVALNDYSSEIPIEDFAKYHTIIALKRDGQYMPCATRDRCSSSTRSTAIPTSRARSSTADRSGR